APDGSFYVAGQQAGPSIGNHAFLVHLTGAGALDESFGTGGVLTSGQTTGNDLLIQSDGKIVVGGIGRGGFGLSRYNADGTPDSTFGSGGFVSTSAFGGHATTASDLHRLEFGPFGRIIAVGEADLNTSFTASMGVAEYLPNGQLDSGFGTNGTALVPFGQASVAWSSAILPDGQIVAAGDANGVLTLTRFNGPA